MQIADLYEDTGSVALNDTDLEDGTEDWFVYFYHPECQRCQLFKPMWAMFARKCKEEGKRVNVGRMNLLENLNTARRFQIIVFPTLLYFHSEQYYNYTGPLYEANLLAVVDGDYKSYPKHSIPPQITALRDWYLFLTWWFWYLRYSFLVVIICVILTLAVCKIKKRAWNPVKQD